MKHYRHISFLRFALLALGLPCPYSLTAYGYNFLTQMQKNTESLGSLFDAQPSQLTGNIHCLTIFTTCLVCSARGGTTIKPSFWPN